MKHIKSKIVIKFLKEPPEVMNFLINVIIIENETIIFARNNNFFWSALLIDAATSTK